MYNLLNGKNRLSVPEILGENLLSKLFRNYQVTETRSGCCCGTLRGKEDKAPLQASQHKQR